MRIGISTLMIQRGKTGVAQYIFGLLRALERRAGPHQFTLFVLQDDLSLFKEGTEKMEIVVVPEEYRAPVKNILWHQWCLPRLTREHGLNLLHVPSYRRLPGFRPCPLVATIHDLAPFRVANKYDWKRMFYGRVVVRWLAARQNRIIAVSHQTARDIARFFRLPPSRIEVIHNGIDHERFSPGPTEMAKAWAAQRHGLDRPFFLYVARLEHPAKNHRRLISAFDAFKAATNSPWQLVFAGSDWHGAEMIHSAIAQSASRQDIRCLGFVSDAELPNLYRAADAFVYPSLFEGFGLPPLEAMACGCPVISSTRGSLEEVIGEAALTVNPEDVGQIASQLGRIALDHTLRDQVSAAGIQQAKRFDWNRTAAETVKVYEQTAGVTSDSHFLNGCKAPIGY